MVGYEDNVPVGDERESVLAPWKAAIDVQARKIEEVRTARAGLVLRAPVGGQITQVRQRPGSGVSSGDSVVTISQDTAIEIIAYLRKSNRSRPNPAGGFYSVAVAHRGTVPKLRFCAPRPP